MLNLHPMFALYRYFLAADAMLKYSSKHIQDDQYWRALRIDPILGYAVIFHLGPPGIGMAYFYSAMYVLIEAWKKLGYRDPKIDFLLESHFVDLLRRFRNATFHFQRDFVSAKWAAFIEEGKESSKWIRELHNAFSGFLMREDNWTGITPPIPQEIKAHITEKPVDEVLKIFFGWWQKHSA
jgi:hypothetical protein